MKVEPKIERDHRLPWQKIDHARAPEAAINGSLDRGVRANDRPTVKSLFGGRGKKRNSGTSMLPFSLLGERTRLIMTEGPGDHKKFMPFVVSVSWFLCAPWSLRILQRIFRQYFGTELYFAKTKLRHSDPSSAQNAP